MHEVEATAENEVEATAENAVEATAENEVEATAENGADIGSSDKTTSIGIGSGNEIELPGVRVSTLRKSCSDRWLFTTREV